MIFVKGNYANPKITEVVAFNAENDTTYEVFKEFYERGLLDAYTETDRHDKSSAEQSEKADGEAELIQSYNAELYTCGTESNFRTRQNATLPNGFKSFGYYGSFTIRDGIYRKDEAGVSGNSEINSVDEIILALETPTKDVDATRFNLEIDEEM